MPRGNYDNRNAASAPSSGNSDRPLSKEERRALRQARREEQRAERFEQEFGRPPSGNFVHKPYQGKTNSDGNGAVPDSRRKSDAGKRHAMSRAEQERLRAKEAQRAAEEQRRRQKLAKLKAVKAKWHFKSGIAVNGFKVHGGMFYAGSDTSDLVDPSLMEPSLISPVYTVAKRSDEAEELPPFPCYEYISPEQRRKYLEFLASNRKSADDIGYVFLYSYGLERRLIVDARKPGEVSREERARLAKEVARLLRAFGPRSKSLSRYLRLLLLYDGTVFDIYKPDELKALLVSPDDIGDWSDNTDALDYLIISRFVEYGIDVPFDRIFDYARARLIRTRCKQLGIDPMDLYDDHVVFLARQRIGHSGFEMRLAVGADGSARNQNKPVYYPGSVSLRRRGLQITEAVCPDVEAMGIDFKALSDIFLTCYYDIERVKEVVSSASLRGIGNVADDALSAYCSRKLKRLASALGDSQVISHVKCSDLVSVVSDALESDLKVTAKGAMTAGTQEAVSVACASIGWQCVLPETVSDELSQTWRISSDDQVVLFKRGFTHTRGSGKRVLAPVFGNDRGERRMEVPDGWRDAVGAGYAYAWFAKEIGEDAEAGDLTQIPQSCYPPFTRRNRTQQISLFFALMYATYYSELSTHGLRVACERTRISTVQSAVFSLCMAKYGYTMPAVAFDAVKKIYSRYPNADQSMILYDYHAGDYRISYDADEQVEFGFDAEQLRETIAETSNVHSILMGAFDDADGGAAFLEQDVPDTIGVGAATMLGAAGDFDDEDDDAEALRDATPPASAGDEDASDAEATPVAKQHPSACIDAKTGLTRTGAAHAPAQRERDEEAFTAWEDVRAVFGDGDEASFADVRAALEAHGAKTSGDAMSLIARINDAVWHGEEIIEIDGEDVYLNEPR